MEQYTIYVRYKVPDRIAKGLQAEKLAEAIGKDIIESLADFGLTDMDQKDIGFDVVVDKVSVLAHWTN